MIPNYYQPTNALIWVQGIEAAKSYMVAPNNTVTLWDSERQSIYLKSADAVGMPSMRIIDYTFRDNQPTSINRDNSDSVTKDDILSLQKEIDEIKAKMEPKKATKKEVVENE